MNHLFDNKGLLKQYNRMAGISKRTFVNRLRESATGRKTRVLKGLNENYF